MKDININSMKTLLLNTIENALNAYLLSDEHSNVRLKKLSGKSISILLMPFKLNFICHFTNTHVSITINDTTTPHTSIKGTPLQLFGALVDKNNRRHFFADDVSIEGDAECAQQVIELFDNVHIDWEEQTSRLIGDVPAYKLNKLTSNIKSWLGKNMAQCSQDINDYLHEEADWFPVRADLEEFFTDIDNLRMDTDRLVSRLDQLKSRLDNEEAS